MPKLRSVFLVLTLALLFSGCETLSPIKAFTNKGMNDSMNKTLHSYELIVRWGELSQIYSFLHPDLAKNAKIQSNLNNIRVTSYETIRGPVSTSETEVIQSVRILYIHNDRQIQNTLVDHQKWSYDANKKEWRRTNPIPKF